MTLNYLKQRDNTVLRPTLVITLACLLSLLAACTSTPSKKPLPTYRVNQLQKQPLAQRLAVPIKAVKRQDLQDTWGVARQRGRRHEGIDIMVPRGTKVYSTTQGLVASLSSNRLGGKVVWILGPQGSWHYYAHLNAHKRGLRVGDYVKQGDLIGYVGNTGNARHTLPHLHYGIYLSGKGRGAVNPYLYLR